MVRFLEIWYDTSMKQQDGFIEITGIIFIVIVVMAVMLSGGFKISESTPVTSPTPIQGTIVTRTPMLPQVRSVSTESAQPTLSISPTPQADF